MRFRFVLLLTALLGTSAFVYNLLYYAVSPGADDAFADYQACIAAPGAGAPAADPGAYARGVLSCTASHEREKAWWILAGLVLLALAAVAVHLAAPRLRTWRQKLEPLEPEDDPEDAALLRELRSLVAEAGLRTAPRFLVAVGRWDVGARAFGRAGDYRVQLNETLLTRGREDPALLRAFVRHELAHIRNKDVDITQLTVALAVVFVPLGLAPLAVALAGTDPQDLFGVTWRAAVLVALVYLTAAAVSRAREHAADVRAASWGDARAHLRRVLGVPAGRPWWSRGPLRLHPRAERRVAAIESPEVLFRIGFGECFAAGLAATVAAAGLHTLLWLGFNHLGPRDSRWVVALVLAPAVVAVVATGLWRAALWARSDAAPPGTGGPRTLLPALGLAAGLVLGRLVPAENGILRSGSSPLPTAAATAASLGLCLFVVLFLRWVVRGATLWLPASGRLGRGTWAAGLAAMAVPLSVLLGWWLMLYDMADGLGPVHDGARADHRAVAAVAALEPFWPWAVLEHPLARLFHEWTPAVLAVVVLWAFPLAALGRRGAAGPDSGWARWVVVTALAGTAVLAAALLGTRVWAHAHVAEELRRQGAYRVAFHHWSVAAAVVLQGVVAAVVTAGLARSHRSLGRPVVPFALLAAFVTGCLATGVIFAGSVAGGCWDALALVSGPCEAGLDAGFVRDTLLRTVVAGAASALVGAGIAAAVVSLRARRPGAAPAAVSVPVSREQRGLLALALLLAVAVATTGLVAGTPGAATAGAPPAAPPAGVPGGAARACERFDEVMGSGASSADRNAGLFDAVRLAVEGGNAALAMAIQDLVRAVPRGDLSAFTDAGDRIRAQCAREGAPLRRF
ncbi:M48 family metalloprotease [Streptomyces glaucescens]|uniref:M48 family metalloprotease n=1 Tax=Streptomyces glaucescens TaxID=1907 RepID=UPI00344F6587